MRQFFKIDINSLPEAVPTLPNRLLPFIWYFVRQAKWQFFFAGTVHFLSSVLEILPFYFVKVVIDAFDRHETARSLLNELFWPLVAFVLLALILQPILARFSQYLMANLRPAFTNLMRRQLAIYMHSHSYKYFQEDFAGRLASKVVETPSAIALIVQMLLGSIGFATTTLLISFILFSQIFWLFALLTFFWAFLYACLLKIYIPKIMSRSKNAFDHQSIVRGRFVDTLTNIMTVKLFARKKQEDSYLLNALKNATSQGQKMMHTMNGLQIWLEVLSVAFVAGSFAAAIYGWDAGALSAGDIALALPLIIRLMNMSWWMSDVFTSLFESFGQIEEGMETITGKHEVTNKPHAPKIHISKGQIDFKDVQFAYGQNAVFERFSLTIPKGQKVGLVGPSGAGKSSLMQILLRLYDIQSGEILIDEQNIAHVQQDSLRENIAVIPQMTDLFHRSIRDNIGYGRLDATDEEIIDAAKKAYAHDFILDLSDSKGNTGYDTLVGERGVKLSGGQRQRIAIARAILKDAPILILDEATSALDSESEQLIQSSLKNLMAGKTVIAIAHRLSTISALDRLVVMEGGTIIEDGSHNELLTKGGLYARLWNMQSGGFLKI